MKTFRDPQLAGRWAPRAVAVIGKFDAVHRGHQHLIGLAKARAQEIGARTMVVTFDPHPRQFFEPRTFRPMLRLKEKLHLLAGLGVDGVVLLAFDRRLARQTPGNFARGILAGDLNPSEIFVGRDFCFGRNRSGDIETLHSLGQELGFTVNGAEPVCLGGRKIDSATIAKLLETGQTAEAEYLLGRPLKR